MLTRYSVGALPTSIGSAIWQAKIESVDASETMPARRELERLHEDTHTTCACTFILGSLTSVPSKAFFEGTSRDASSLRGRGMLQLLVAALVAGAAIPMGGASQMGRGASKQPKARRIDSTADSREIADLGAGLTAGTQQVFKWDVSSHALVVTTEDGPGNCVSLVGTLPQNTGPKLPKSANIKRLGGGSVGMALRMGSAAAGVASKRGKGGSQPGLMGVPVAQVDRLE